MALSRTEAIILKSQKQGETTKLLTLYTKAFGKIKALAKGARTSRSRYWGALEPLNQVQVVFYRKEHRELHYISQADIQQSFLRIRAELGRTSLALMSCEWVNLMEEGEEKNLRMFVLFSDTLRNLDTAQCGLKNIVRSFMLHSLALHGFKPHLSGCAACGSSTVSEPVAFDMLAGNYTCAKCSSVNGVRLSSQSLTLLRWLDRVMPEQAGGVNVSPELGNEIDMLLLHYGASHIESLKRMKVPGVISAMTAHLHNCTNE